jgi:hypothetical protein
MNSLVFCLLVLVLQVYAGTIPPDWKNREAAGQLLFAYSQPSNAELMATSTFSLRPTLLIVI